MSLQFKKGRGMYSQSTGQTDYLTYYIVSLIISFISLQFKALTNFYF